MEINSEEQATKLLQAQTHVWNHILKFITSMSLKCAIDLSIPDIIHKYGQPMPLSQLIASLPIHPSKNCFIHRLMLILTHSGFFSEHKVNENDEEVRYVLTDASKLLIKDQHLSMASMVDVVLDPRLVNPWHQFSNWLTNEDPTTFYTQNGISFYDFAERDPKFNDLFNDAMAGDTQLVSSVMSEKCKDMFEGLESSVDVGGGTGTMAKIIDKSFPQLKCIIVFDLPHVVADLQGTDNIKFVGGNMFEANPSADSIMLKSILHNWNDEDCVKILKKCKEAIPSHGKIIIIDIVMESKKELDDKLVERYGNDDAFNWKRKKRERMGQIDFLRRFQ